MTTRDIAFLRVFVASPGDVTEERQVVYESVHRLPYDPAFRDQVATQIVAWDGPYSSVPMLANVDPQTAIERGLPRPSECDVVVVMLWRRMGTPLGPNYRKADGRPFRSGTEWEFYDAVSASERNGRPTVLVYQRTEVPTEPLDQTVDQLTVAKRQYEAVKEFISELREQPCGINLYRDVAAFGKLFEGHIKEIVRQLLTKPTTEIERIIESTPAGSALDLHESQLPGALAFAADRLRPPHLRQLCADAIRSWMSEAEEHGNSIASILQLARDLQSDPDPELAKSGVRLVRALANGGHAGSRDLRNAATHRNWEVRSATVTALAEIDDDYVFRTASDIRLTYHVPLRRLAKHATEKARTLSAEERAAAVALLSRLSENPDVSDQTRRRLLAAVNDVESSPTNEPST